MFATSSEASLLRTAIPVQHGIHPAEDWFRRNHRTRDEQGFPQTFRVINKLGRGSSPCLKAGVSAATTLMSHVGQAFSLTLGLSLVRLKA